MTYVTTITLRVKTLKPLPSEFANRCAARLSSMHSLDGGSIEAVEPEPVRIAEKPLASDEVKE